MKLPGCKNGYCNEAFECNCDKGWSGAFCDEPICRNCNNGYCSAPDSCTCFDGWTGPACDQCVVKEGCLHGHCGDHPHTCVCNNGWGGYLCDQPVCRVECLHGVCQVAETNFCLCQSGWRGEACDKCSPYWKCPNQVRAKTILNNVNFFFVSNINLIVYFLCIYF